MSNITLVRWQDVNLTKERWNNCIKSAIENYKISYFKQCVDKQLASDRRFYKHLSFRVNYMKTNLKRSDLSLIIKARCDILDLNGNRFGTTEDKRCSLCNLNTIENVFHFMGECP